MVFDDSKRCKITLANGGYMASLGIGDGFIRYYVAGEVKNIPFKNEMFVQNLESKLVSVKQLTRQGNTVIFKDDCRTIDKSDTVLIERKYDRDLFKLV